MKEKFDNIYAILNEAEEDLTKFDEKGNKAAGTRLRKAMQQIKALAQEIRVEVQDRKNAEKDAE